MTPYARRMNAGALAALAIAATGYATHPGAAAPAAIERIAPGGNITSVVRATAARGWPHAPNARERSDVATIALHTYTPPNARGGTFCTFGAYLGKVRCTLQVNDRVYRVTVSVYEDGSWRIGRRPTR